MTISSGASNGATTYAELGRVRWEGRSLPVLDLRAANGRLPPRGQVSEPKVYRARRPSSPPGRVVYRSFFEA